ncbi:MAG: hypothetical protein ACM3MK_06750 [Chitinophagales bacterium]
MKRLLFLRGKEPNFERAINDMIFDEQYKIIDITMLEWDKMQRQYIIGLAIEEQEKFFRQNVLVLENKVLDNITKDLDDFSDVMCKAKNVPYNITLIKTFQIRSPRGDKYYAYIVYED